VSASIRSSHMSDPLARRIYAQQVRLLYEQAPFGSIASLLIAPTLTLILWNVMSHTVLLLWLALLETTLLIRLGVAIAFQRCSHVDDDPARWAIRYISACAASGICWGAAVILLTLSPSLVYDSFIALVLGGVLMGGVLTMTPVLNAYLAYALPLILPTVLWLLLQDDLIRVTMGAAGLLYLLLAMGTAHRYHQTLTQSLRLALNNGELAQSFAAAREQAEENHQRLAEQQEALKDSVDAMRELHRVISTPVSCLERMQALLAMGCQRFGLPIGILAHIEGEHYEIVQAQTPDGEIRPGQVFALGDTYCRDTLRAQGPLGFEHAATGLQRHHPCYQKFGLEAYLGVPMRVGGVLYGTLNFSALQPRLTPFTTVDRELIQLMAQWMSGALEQERMSATAQRQQTLLAHASRLNALGEMVSGLIHEINQPITAINLYAEAGLARLRHPTLEPEEMRETLGKIAAQSARTSAIIQKIRHFARQGKPQYTQAHLPELLDEIADFLNLEAERHAIHISYNLPLELPPVLVDGLQVQQVILNLVRNAIDAINGSQGAHTIVVAACLDQEAVEISVQDTGPGLAPGIAGQLLHPFFTTKPNGLGLGLSISRSIIEAHGGRLWATSNSGCGVTFHFTLPLVQNAHAAEHTAQSVEFG
jgi:signal transduction histidine kinase